MNVLIIAGAGTSVELGVPGMAGLAEEFIDHSRQWDIEPSIVDQILGRTPDIEHLIEELDHICTARGSLQAIGENNLKFERYDKVRAEVEWFIQHAAERVLPREAALMWGGTLRASCHLNLTIVTTNYDRAIELAANAERVRLDDGFGDFDQRETAAWRGFGRSSGQLTLAKIHGSTDWYSEGDSGSPTKLRHPMPLFGRAELQLPDGSRLGSALILPSREKLLTRDPYPRLSQAFLNACDTCELAVIIGSSLRDHHLRGAAQSIANRAPTFVVNPSGTAQGIVNASAIAKNASSFLIGILPAALASSDPVKWLESIGSNKSAHNGSSLHSLRAALDDDEETFARCRAVEQLVEEGLVLDTHWMGQLLECSDPHVARYALGLIAQSPQQDELLKLAASSVHVESNAAFSEDFSILKEMTAAKVAG